MSDTQEIGNSIPLSVFFIRIRRLSSIIVVTKYYYDIDFYIDDDYLNEDNFCTFIFDSISDVIEVIQLLYPIATFDIKIDLNYKSAIINNFDNHLYEYKKYRK